MYLIYHHDDMDGKTAAFHIHQYLAEHKGESLVASDFIMRGYDEPFSERDYGGKDVFIVDLSFTKDSILKLFDICEGANSVTWIDHHLSSKQAIEEDEIKEKLDKYDNLEYLVYTEMSATMLTYIYWSFAQAEKESFARVVMNADDDLDIHYSNDLFTRMSIHTGDFDLEFENLPPYLQYVDRYDRWVYGDDDMPVLFSYGCYTQNTNLFVKPNAKSRVLEFNPFWTRIHMYTFTGSIIDDGRVAKKYADVCNRSNLLEAGYTRDILGYKAIILNTFGNSMVFGPEAPEKYDVLCIYNYNGKTKNFNYSFYSSKPNVNCAEIAHHFDKNGGGHKGAAGCSSKEFLFK